MSRVDEIKGRHTGQLVDSGQHNYEDITYLLSEVERLRKALKPLANMEKERGPWSHADGCPAEIEDTDNVLCSCGSWSAIDNAKQVLEEA